ncbi:winged helix-turn-helix transcriptional regulator [Candidatus Bathyarchaeota archaeon]|nr:winged helix-turn-helix transcriptional regulator [Candidatus Bathyarchaeota archaeon]
MRKISRVRARIFKALADPVRLEILEFLRDGEKCVCEIVPYVGISQPLVSRHLAILKRCGLVRSRKEGNRRLYSITNPAIFRVIEAVDIAFAEALMKHAVEQMV